MSTSLTIPAEVVVHLRCGLHSDIGPVAFEIDEVSTRADRETRPGLYDESLGRLDVIRELLDMVGWTPAENPMPVEIDLDRHGPAIVSALNGLLTIARDHMGVDPAFAGAENQRTRANRTAREIEGFLASNGLPIVAPD
ncbi:MAG TPA: hypothetical protein VH081_01305 [Solirubrobacteraceae bacterium]|jgi:hypothetical protein|nr:hypothetical protein [Solirubrobacteraceae bacterium]